MPLRILLAFAAPYRNQLMLVGLLTIFSSVAMLSVPWLAAQLIGGFIASDGAVSTSLIGLLLVALVSLALLSFLVANLSARTGARLLADLRLQTYEHLQSLPLAFHENHRQGDTLALMTYEVAKLSQFLTGTLVSIPSRLLTAAGAIILMLRIDLTLALIVPLLVPVFYVVVKVIGRRLRGIARAIQQSEAEVVAIAEENLEMLPAIKAFTGEDRETARYGEQVAGAMELRLSESRIFAAMEPAISLIAACAAILLVVLAGRNVAAGGMSPTELFGFLFYAALLTRPVGALANVYGQVQSARGTLARLQSVFGEPTEAGYSATGQVCAVKGDIAFNGVSFAYPGREQTLDDVDLRIRPGEVVALTGHNGAGKSTLISLLLRFYEPDRGEISLDGRNIATLNVRSLRRQFGLVSQRVFLFNGTVRANIAYGAENAGDADVEAAARLAQALDFINELPAGLDTEIGDHGVRLSGGQRQRIALARALIGNPPILILDEATSMYDPDGESAFVDACKTALKGRTVILITHRPASLALANRLVLVEDGRVREILQSAHANSEVAG